MHPSFTDPFSDVEAAYVFQSKCVSFQMVAWKKLLKRMEGQTSGSGVLGVLRGRQLGQKVEVIGPDAQLKDGGSEKT